MRVRQVQDAFAEQFESRGINSLQSKYYKLTHRQPARTAATSQAAAEPSMTQPPLFTPPSPSADVPSSKKWRSVYRGSNRPNGQYKGEWSIDCSKHHKHTSVCDRQNGVGDFKDEERGVFYTGQWLHGR